MHITSLSGYKNPFGIIIRVTFSYVKLGSFWSLVISVRFIFAVVFRFYLGLFRRLFGVVWGTDNRTSAEKLDPNTAIRTIGPYRAHTALTEPVVQPSPIDRHPPAHQPVHVCIRM